MLVAIGSCDADIKVVMSGDSMIAGYSTKLARIASREMEPFSVSDYLFADKQPRGLGLGELLYSRSMALHRYQGGQGHLSEIRDALLPHPIELYGDTLRGTTSKQRLGFLKELEHQVINTAWLQPPLGERKGAIDFYMVLLSTLTASRP